ncbi:MAG: phasin family protein [Sphingomicrobium sp.]
MANETNIQAQAAADAPAKVAEAVAATVTKIADESAKAAKRTRASAARKIKRQAAAAKTATRRTVRKSKRSASAKQGATVRKQRSTARKSTTAARTAAAAVNQGIETVTSNYFNGFKGFDAVPSFAPFQNMFAQANEQGQQLVERSRKVAEELADLARANVEAMVEASRTAAEGARAVAQDAASSSRDGMEQAAGAIRSLADAKSPTEYLQLQSEIARASFDRAVAESSKLTETMVKLAGEAFQPLSNRASANAERFNTLVA